MKANGRCTVCGERVPEGGFRGNLFHCSDRCMGESRWAHSPDNPNNWSPMDSRWDELE